ncbi:hypothetical protein PNOK_0520800 [Pyrrhoderma noxium]|uniref:Uncharacterized protein n=1 Tax=Pyrrhoderma noxium TaxID=2282107 RepID=A0A286UFI8_9AGAM|nr:hypothetical protein PNOK_0520800 [Pyrrhoderma noxium]
MMPSANSGDIGRIDISGRNKGAIDRLVKTGMGGREDESLAAIRAMFFRHRLSVNYTSQLIILVSISSTS